MERASLPHFQISPDLSKSVVNVIIRKLFICHSLFPRHTRPSLLPVKVAVSVLSLHQAASEPSNKGTEIK